RVVPSPEPVGVVELGAIRRLAEQDVLVICAGGGGIPVCRTQDGKLEGVEAVIDKDRAAAALANDLGASELIMLTDVPAVVSGWGTDHARSYRTISAATLAEEPFAPGSMGPKVEAARRFVANPDRVARIGSLDQAVATARGAAGTTVTAAGESSWWPQAVPV
ncbi:MAG TPA: carbamate kinase, partial [Thermoleophilia bacterium]|nr:carbamate kinase [Thermoleophilia bacterium]